MKGIRRKEKEIKDRAEILGILREAKYVTIAMTDADGPYLATITHAYDEGRNAIYFHCAQEGRKVEVLKKDNRVWGQALLDLGYSHGNCDHLYKTAQFKGRVSFVIDPSEKRLALEMMIRKNEKDPDAVIRRQLTADSVNRVNVGRIDVEYMSGKRSDRVVISL